MTRIWRVIFWWLAVPLLLVILGGTAAYLNGPKPPAMNGQPTDTNLNTLVGRLRNLFVPADKKVSVVGEAPIPILMYHFVRDGVNPTTDQLGYNLSVPTAEFAEQMKYLSNSGYTAVTMSQVAKGEVPAKAVALTFDDGYADFGSEAYPILNNRNFTATVYVITSRLNDSRHLSPEDIVYLSNRGIEFGSHTVNHVNLAHQPDSVARDELAKSQKTLATLTGKPVTALSYPSGQYDQSTVRLAKQLGYTSAVTTVNGTADPSKDLYRLARIRIKRGITLNEFKALLKSTPVVVAPEITDTSRAL